MLNISWSPTPAAWLKNHFRLVANMLGVPQLHYVLGLHLTTVVGRGSANIKMQTQTAFFPERLLIPSKIADDFLITDIKVGQNSQFLSTGAMPASAFTETVTGVRMKMDECKVAMAIVVSVTNMNPEDRHFYGIISGPGND